MNSYLSKMNTLTQALGVLGVFVLIFPTALVNVFLFLLLLSYFLSADYAGKWQRIRTNPVARASILLFCLLMVGMIYTSANLLEALGTLNTYRELLLLPIAISIFNQAEWRQRAYYAFLAAIGVAVLASFSMRMGWLPPGGHEQEWVPFKGRIAYGFFLGYAVYLMLHHAKRAETLKRRVAWLIFAALSSFDLLFLVSGRTGHVVFLAMLALLLFQYRGLVKKYWLVILLALAALIGTALLTSPAINSRSGDIGMAETNPEKSSLGARIIFWQVSLRIIADHPVLGGGTGSFTNEFAKHAYDHPNMFADNPHNEYFMIATQLGAIGLASFIWLLYSLYRHSYRLPPMYGLAAQGLVVAMAVGCLFNSFLRDHGEGHFFAIYAGLLFSSYASRSEESG